MSTTFTQEQAIFIIKGMFRDPKLADEIIGAISNNPQLTSPWVKVSDRFPVKSDEDRNGNVLVIFPKGFIQYIGWKDAASTGRGVAWMTPPNLPTPEPEQVEDGFRAWWDMKKLKLDFLTVPDASARKIWLAAQEKGKV